MAATEYILNTDIRRNFFTTYGGTLSQFQTALRADWPNDLGGSFEVLATTAAPTVAILVVPNGPTLTVPAGSSVGLNYGSWQVLSAAQLAAKYTAASI